MGLLFYLLVSLSPTQSARLAAYLFQQPHLAPTLIRICQRESRCNPVQAHQGDAKWSPKAYRRAAYKGWVDPTCQPYAPGQYSTRGSFGLMAAYHLHFLAPCAPPRALDVPFLSALAAAQKLTEHCSKRPQDRISATNRWAEAHNAGGCKKKWRNRAKRLDYRLARSLIRGVLSAIMASPQKDKKDEKRTEDELPLVEPPARTDDGTPVKPLKRMG